MAEINFERRTVKALCFHYFVNKVDDHTGGDYQRETTWGPVAMTNEVVLPFFVR